MMKTSSVWKSLEQGEKFQPHFHLLTKELKILEFNFGNHLSGPTQAWGCLKWLFKHWAGGGGWLMRGAPLSCHSLPACHPAASFHTLILFLLTEGQIGAVATHLFLKSCQGDAVLISCFHRHSKQDSSATSFWPGRAEWPLHFPYLASCHLQGPALWLFSPSAQAVQSMLGKESSSSPKRTAWSGGGIPVWGQVSSQTDIQGRQWTCVGCLHLHTISPNLLPESAALPHLMDGLAQPTCTCWSLGTCFTCRSSLVRSLTSPHRAGKDFIANPGKLLHIMNQSTGSYVLTSFVPLMPLVEQVLKQCKNFQHRVACNETSAAVLLLALWNKAFSVSV